MELSIADRCILRDGLGREFLFARYSSYHLTEAQVHDGSEIVAELRQNLTGRKSQAYIVTTYTPTGNIHQRQISKITFHGSKEAAVKTMIRRAEVEFIERHNEAERRRIANTNAA